MENSLEQLKKLRDTTKKEVAQKIISLVKYIEENDLDVLLSTWNRCYNTAYNGMYTEMLIINADVEDGIDCVSMDLSDIRENKIDDVIADIVNINQKPRYEGKGDYGTSGYYCPNIRECQNWINKKIIQVAELEKKEIEELQDILKAIN